MGKSESKRKNLNGNKQGQFMSIEKKISKRFGQVIILCCVILGVISSILSYISSVSAVSATIDDTSDVAASYVAAALRVYTSIAYETGSIARLADPERAVEDKKAILQQRIDDHNFTSGYLLDSNGIDVITGTDFSDRDFFKEAMKGNTYISTPAYSDVTKQVSFAVAAPLWDGGVPHTKPVGAVVYVPNGEDLNNIMRTISVGDGGTAFMIDANGITIADINSENVGVEDCIKAGELDHRLKDFSEICKKMAAGESGVGTYSYGGVTKVVAYSPVANTEGWSIGVAAVRNEFLGKLWLSIILTVLAVVIFTVVGVKNGINLGKTVAAPLRVRLNVLNFWHREICIPIHRYQKPMMRLQY